MPTVLTLKCGTPVPMELRADGRWHPRRGLTDEERAALLRMIQEDGARILLFDRRVGVPTPGGGVKCPRRTASGSSGGEQ